MMDVSSLSMASMAKVSMASLSRGSEVSRTIGEGSADGSEPRTPSRRNRRRARAKPRTPSIEELDLGGWFHPDGSMTYKPSASAATRRPSSADRGVPFWERFKEADTTTPKRPRSAYACFQAAGTLGGGDAGRKWKTMTSEQKQPFEAKAVEVRSLLP